MNSDVSAQSVFDYYGITDYEKQIVRYQETFADSLKDKLVSPKQFEDWQKNGIYLGHYKTGLGEILSYTALPRLIKTHFPEMKVYFCGHRFAEPLFRQNPYVDQVADFKEREPYGSGKEFGFGTTTQKRLRSIGIFTTETLGPEVFVSDEVLNRWREWKAKLPLQGRKLVLVQSSGRTNPKVFSLWTWLRLLRSMRDEFYFVQIGNLRDQFIWAQQVHLKQWDMEDMAGALKTADAFMGPNSGVMHLASAVATPAVILHNEAKASEMMFPLLADNWLLPKEANHHLFHAYPWHHHVVIDQLWDLPSASGFFAERAKRSSIRESLRLAVKGENPAWTELKRQITSSPTVLKLGS